MSEQPNKEVSSAELKKRQEIDANAKNIEAAARAFQHNPWVKAGLVANNLTGGRLARGLGKGMRINNNLSPKGRALQAMSNKLSKSGASDEIGKATSAKNGAGGAGSSKAQRNKLPSKKSDKQKDKEDKAKAQSSGNFQIGFKRSTKIKLIIFAAIGSFCLTMIVTMISMIADSEGSAIVMGEMVGEDRDFVKENSESLRDDTGTSLEDTGTGNSSVLKEYEERFKLLGNVFSSESVKCDGEECLSRPEYRYYLKVADIAYRYRKKYNIKLDLVLLNATAQYNEMTQEAIMELHMHDYDLDAVEDVDKLMDLDWDYDYKKISGYKYLDPDDYRYDLQILAKNMVTKTTTQQCTTSTTNSEGKVDIKVTKEQVDIDVEDKYFKSGASHYLKCDSGEKYSIFSLYKLDLEKYDEFLLEYLENKFYLSDDSYKGNYTGFRCLSREFTKYDLTDDQLAQLASVAYHEQGTAKGAAAEASLMANLFEQKGSKYGKGADGLYNYVRNSGWFAHAADHMDDYAASEEIIAAVKSVLVDGKRTIPGYINEHDWIYDLESVTTNGKTVDRKDRSAYVPFETVIKNVYGATYTFYSFPDTNSDPFGYTSESMREEIGDFHYDYDTGEPVSCSVGGNDLSSAFVNLALSQQGISGNPNIFTKWHGPLSSYPSDGYEYPWCATFVSWVITHTEYEGQKLSDIIGYKSASVNSFATYFASAPNLQYVESEYYGGSYVPKQGDLIFFAWQDKNGSCTYTGIGSMDHIGIVVEVKDGVVYTIEGNTSNSVAMRQYDLDSCSVSSYGVWY